MTTKEAIPALQTLLLTLGFGQPKVKEALAVAIRELDREYTSTPPTVPGAYWWRRDSDSQEAVLNVIYDAEVGTVLGLRC